MKKNISKLFDNKKLNSIDQIVGGVGGTGTDCDTVNGIAYDTKTTNYPRVGAPSPDGTNTGLIGSTGEKDNPEISTTKFD